MKKMEFKLQSAPLHELHACETAINQWANSKIADGYEIQDLSVREVQNQILVIAIAVLSTGPQPAAECPHQGQRPCQATLQTCLPQSTQPTEDSKPDTAPSDDEHTSQAALLPEPSHDEPSDTKREEPEQPSTPSPQRRLLLTQPDDSKVAAQADAHEHAVTAHTDNPAPLDTALLPTGVDENGQPYPVAPSLLPAAPRPTIGSVGAPQPSNVATARPAATAPSGPHPGARPTIADPPTDDGTGTAWQQSSRTGVWWRHYDHAGTGQVGERKSAPGCWWRIIGPGGTKLTSGICANSHEGRQNCDSFMRIPATA